MKPIPPIKKSTSKKEKVLLSVDRSDNCIYLNDLRGEKQSIHMTPEQVENIGEALVEISKKRSGKNQTTLQKVNFY